MRQKFHFKLGLALLCVTSVWALEVPPHTGLVVDQAGLLSEAERSQIASSLSRFQSDYGPQIQLLTIPELGSGETIETYAIKVADQWKLGDAKRDDGVLLLVSKNDRAIRIEVGQGLEGQLPDVTAGRVISGVILPFFKQGQYSAGIVSGLNAIAHGLGGELKSLPAYSRIRRSKGGGLPWPLELGVLLVFLWLTFSRLGHRGPMGHMGRGLLLGGALGAAGRRHSSGGFGGGFGGGGFGGGGGGGFSGGGASGKW